MATNLVIPRTNVNSVGPDQPDYGRFGAFASRTKRLSMCSDAFGEVLSFLGPKDLARSEKVCKSWKQFSRDKWKRQCQIQLGLSLKIDPKRYLPEGLSYKKSLQLMSSSILDGDVYRRYVGEVGAVPRIPEMISLKKWKERDRCDPTQTVGAEYVWMYSPPYIETNLEGFYLDKPDNPNDPEAPRLLQREVGLVEKIARKFGLGTKPENKVLKIPVTINNIEELFKNPKIGNPSKYNYTWNKIIEQHGNKRIPSGWICLRRNVIGRGLNFAAHQALANEKGLIISQLGHRILFNFLEYVHLGTYPDGLDPLTFARTLTHTRDEEGIMRPPVCGEGGPSGLSAYNDDLSINLGHVSIGVGVEFPAEIQNIDP